MVQTPRKSPVPRRIGDVIGDSTLASGPNADSTLSGLCRKAREFTRIQALLARHSGPDLSGQFQVANIRQDRLVLVTPTASWATRLRMQAPQYLSVLQTHGYGQIRHIDIRVAPLHREADVERSRRSLSPAASYALEQMKRFRTDS